MGKKSITYLTNYRKRSWHNVEYGEAEAKRLCALGKHRGGQEKAGSRSEEQSRKRMAGAGRTGPVHISTLPKLTTKLASLMQL